MTSEKKWTVVDGIFLLYLKCVDAFLIPDWIKYKQLQF